jgi:hypothetical protein
MPQKAINHDEIAQTNTDRNRNKAGINNSTDSMSNKKYDRNERQDEVGVSVLVCHVSTFRFVTSYSM